jgi:hypothetical protein
MPCARWVSKLSFSCQPVPPGNALTLGDIASKCFKAWAFCECMGCSGAVQCIMRALCSCVQELARAHARAFVPHFTPEGGGQTHGVLLRLCVGARRCAVSAGELGSAVVASSLASRGRDGGQAGVRSPLWEVSTPPLLSVD